MLKIGSVAFIPASSRKTSNRLQLSELLLLFLRCALVLLLSFFLAKPQSSNPAADKKESGWIIADPGVNSQTISNHQLLLDSLQNNGYAFRKWDTSLSELSYKQWTEELKKNQPAFEIHPWELVYLINRKVPEDFPVYVFSGNQLRLFNGRRPASHADIRWIFNQAQSDFIMHIGKSRFNSGDSAPTKIIIVDEPGKNDGTYVKAAIEAIGSATAIPVEIKSLRDRDSLQNDADWLFWLSEKPVPGTIKAGNIFSYAPGKPGENNSVLLTKGDHRSTGSEVHLLRTVDGSVDPDGDRMIWHDASGEAILYRDSANFSRLIFRSRFNPAWSDLVWNESFPYRLFALLFEKNGIENIQNNDLRILDTSQVRSNFSKTATRDREIPVAESQVAQWVWWILILTFCMERIVALYSKTSSR